MIAVSTRGSSANSLTMVFWMSATAGGQAGHQVLKT
jgi:hypothetical protein